MEQLLKWLNDGHGRRVALARACGVTHSAVSQWDRVPSNHVLTVARVTGIDREVLRPDLYIEEPAR